MFFTYKNIIIHYLSLIINLFCSVFV